MASDFLAAVKMTDRTGNRVRNGRARKQVEWKAGRNCSRPPPFGRDLMQRDWQRSYPGPKSRFDPRGEPSPVQSIARESRNPDDELFRRQLSTSSFVRSFCLLLVTRE